MLNIVSTPIGNLDDLSYRQAKTLTESDVVLAEDTRSYQKLLTGIEKIFRLQPRTDQKIISYYKEVEFEKLPEVIGLLEENKAVALISEAGTPIISDPGFLLIKEVVKRNISFDVIPGPSAVTNALVLSGLKAEKWMFVGFLPKKRNDLIKLFHSLKEIKKNVFVAFESTQRINDSLKVLSEIDPETEVVITREMTKKFQEVLRGKPSYLIGKVTKGEVTIAFRFNSS